MRVARPAEASPDCCVAALRGETGRRTPGNRSDAVTSTVRSRRWEIGSKARCGLRMTADRTSVRPVRPTVWRPWAEPVNGLFGGVGADVRRAARVCGKAVPERGQAGCMRSGCGPPEIEPAARQGREPEVGSRAVDRQACRKTGGTAEGWRARAIGKRRCRKVAEGSGGRRTRDTANRSTTHDAERPPRPRTHERGFRRKPMRRNPSGHSFGSGRHALSGRPQGQP